MTIPSDVAEGSYSGTVIISGASGSINLPVTVEVVPTPSPLVQPNTLPGPSALQQMNPLAWTHLQHAAELQKMCAEHIDSLEDQGAAIPEDIQMQYETASMWLDEAWKYYRSGNYIAANYWALQAIGGFQDVLDMLKALTI